MNPRTLLIAVAAALALLLALLIRKTGSPETAPETPTQRAKESASATPSVVAAPADVAPRPEAAVVTALHGLRLLTREAAEARGWSAPVKMKTPAEILGEATWKKWASTTVSVNVTDAPLADVVADFAQRYGLVARIDEEEIDVESQTVTFRVEDLAADQSMDLILKMADLGWYVDANGVLWITSKDRAREIAAERAPFISPGAKFTASIVAHWGRDEKDEPFMAERRASWMKDRKVSVSIANKSLRETIEEIATAGESNLWGWSEEAEQAVQKAPIASVIGDDLPLDATLEALLAPAGLGMNFWGHDSFQVGTIEEVKNWEDWEKQAREFSKEAARERATLAARKVRIEGKVLTLRAVAAQLEAQLGERVVLMPALEDCGAVWEADGLEQTAGEVLDILGRDAPLDWGWMQEFDPDDPKEGPHTIWLVNRK